MKISLCIFLISSCLMACNTNRQLRDPTWNMHLEGTREEVMNQLQSGEGVKTYLFSFKKEFYVKEAPGPAHIICHSSHPYFENGNLKSFSYTLTVDLKNSEPPGFSTSFYAFLKQKWTNAFGSPNEVLEQPEKITLTWELQNNMLLTITANKLYNSYSIEYTR